MQISLEDAIANLAAKGEALADALNLESQLEDDRALVKPEAIKRIMARDGIAATPAEKIVESDAEYAAHRAKQRAAIVARMGADAAYKAAAARATRASLYTPEMIELEEINRQLEEKVADLAALRDKDTERLTSLASQLISANRRVELVTESERQLRTQRDTLARDLEVAHETLDRYEAERPVL